MFTKFKFAGAGSFSQAPALQYWLVEGRVPVTSVSDPEPDSVGLLDPDSESGSGGLKKGQKC